MVKGEQKMPDLKDSKLVWHGVPREEVEWHPTVEHELCIGCGLCVLGCAANVYKLDFDKNKPMVVARQNCKVGCVTCANTCPVHAISFPSLSYLHKIIKKRDVLTTSKKELKDSADRVRYGK